MNKVSTAQTMSDYTTAAMTQGVDVERYRDIVRDYVEEQEDVPRRPAVSYRGLNRIWQPGFARAGRAEAYFNATPPSRAVYGERLFPARADVAEALFGVLAYDADREFAFSLGNRLVEIGTQTVTGSDGRKRDVLLNLTENPNSDIGEQSLVMNPDAGFSAGEIDQDGLVAALVKTIPLEGAVALERSPGPKGSEHISVQYKVPAAISWDGREHVVHVEANVPLPPSGRPDLVSGILKFLHLNNGRTAQHFPESAAAIRLDEILFADPNAVFVFLDPGTPAHKVVAPDQVFGKKLALLLTQTAGGFFEKSYWQDLSSGTLALAQITAEGEPIRPRRVVTLENTDMGRRRRVTEVALPSAPYRTQYVETEVSINGKAANELCEIRVVADAGEELMSLSFTTGAGRGLRDLGLHSDAFQQGRYKMRLKGQDGFSYGEFVVSPTVTLRAAHPTYYTAIELTPAFPSDMARKKVILHVVQDDAGIYTETQVVPMQYVKPPKQGIREAIEKPLFPQE